MSRLIIWTRGLAMIWLADRARWGRGRTAAGAADGYSHSRRRYSWVENPLLTPNQLSSAKHAGDKPVKTIKNMYKPRGKNVQILPG